MPAPSPLAIATSAVTRLLKEEATYRKELTAQEQRLKRLEEGGTEADDENREFTLRQEVGRYEHFDFSRFQNSKNINASLGVVKLVESSLS